LLAREGNVLHNGAVVFRTPLLIPSFSSKGFREMNKIIKVMTEFITEAVLVSAYDIHHKLLVSRQLTFPSVIFLDSGGYEARVEHDLSEAYGQDYKPKKWTAKDHHDVLAQWQSPRPTIVISYDSPRRHSSIERQLEAALKLKNEFPHFLHEFLVKPEHKNELIEPSAIEKIAGSLNEFSIVGFTEHELDHRIIGRMEKLANIRRILDKNEIASPIHVFGSLDSLSTVLYFLSGAEIFDGLTWLRFGFHNGQTIYRQNYGAIRGENGILKNARELSHSMWKDNYYYLEALRDQMRNYVRTKDCKSFEHISAHIETAVHQLQSRV
jgi:hypothetical protein